MTRQDPAFYVYENGYELVESLENYGTYQVLRNGEMRYTYKNADGTEDILRYTSDLEAKGITTDSELNEAEAEDILLPIDTPWFEVWNNQDDSEEYEVYWELDKARELALELHNNQLAKENN
jgi:hypothetical protein